MALVVGAGIYCEWLEAEEILAVLGFREGGAKSLAEQGVNKEILATSENILVTEPNHLTLLSQWLYEYPQSKVILLYADLPLTLHSIIAQFHISVKEALGVWQQHLDELQSFYRKHQDQTLLFELGQILKYPHQFIHVCATEWQQDLPSSLPEFQAISLSTESEITTVKAQLLREQPELRQRLQYIKAMTWPLDAGVVDIEQPVVSAYDLLDRLQLQMSEQLKVKKKLADLTASFNELNQENARNLEDLVAVREELKSQLLYKNEAQEKLIGLQKKNDKKAQEQQYLIEKMQTKVVSFADENDHFRKENQLILDQLLLVQEELEQEVNIKNSLKKEVTDFQLQLKKIKTDFSACDKKNITQLNEKKHLLEEAYRQINELTTKNNSLLENLNQLRNSYEKSLADYHRSEKKIGDLLHENQLVLEQLLLVQEKLENRFLAEKGALKKIEELKVSIKGNALFVNQINQVKEALMIFHEEQSEPVDASQLVEQTEYPTDRDLILVSDLRTHAPEHTVPPRSFFKRRAYKKAQRLARHRDRERAVQIAQTPWFDANWYLEQYPDIAADPVQSENPALHYIRMGGFEGRNPSPHFDSAFYLEANPDVAVTGLNPLWHFLQNGQAEGRQPQP